MQLNKVGRDSILYVESLIESIMGGLEGLINILDSEGGFGSLEMQVTLIWWYLLWISIILFKTHVNRIFQLAPEQAAFYLNNLQKGSTASFKSPKGLLHKPGYESYPENSSSMKM